MKIKLLKTIGIIGCLGIVGATPVMLTSCKKKSTSQSATVTPQLKKSISGIGSLDEFITTSSKADDVNTNVKFVLNSNKESVIANWVCIPESEKNNISLDTSLVGWDNDNWGSMSFDEWNKANSPTTINWKGSKEQANANEELEFKSNKELKEFLTSNISQIVKNASIDISNKKASLANTDIKVAENGNLLIGVQVNNSETKRNTGGTTNYILSVPSSVINFNPTINVKAQYGSNQTTSTDIVLTYEVTNSNIIDKTFDTSAANKNNIILEEKKSSNEDKIGLWKSVSDIGILKALGWLDDEKKLNDHIDGNGIDSELLNEDAIVSDLKIDGLTKEKLLGIEIEMNQRNVAESDYNGEYSILVSTTINGESNSDLNLNFNTYRIVAQKTAEKQSKLLQANVPNAYIIDTSLDGNKFKNITKEFFGTSFEMGWQNTDSSSESTLLQKNLQNEKIFNKFIEKIDQSSKTNEITLYNGVKISYKSNMRNESQDNNYKETITLNVELKKGFSFKKSFQITENKYNTQGKTSEVTFGISLGNNNGDAAIWKNASKTVDQVATSLGQ
ncbi:hypothetical protein [Malacoplasma iowae]|uniref:hypothetical protein n=1 Tax=Malacoplasma iowae TaxID=2116 RepID=UPI002A18AEDA|nr:hypothetical protein [Malacoplasma iowae]WPL39725.1 hypothetical protein QX183_04200 [Malacoplasma iowae]